MIFNSIEYIIFLPIVFFSYWIVPHKYRNVLLLIASYYFYMSWNAYLVTAILGTTLVSYLTAKFVNKNKGNTAVQKRFMALGVGSSLAVLFVFKYFNFFSESFTALLEVFSLNVGFSPLSLILPVGISFYTFQTLSYVIDVYNKRIEPEKSFITYALYVSFFVQLVAGPIERPENLLPQFHKVHKFNYEKAVYGAKQIALGAFKKVVVADSLAVYVNMIYNDVTEYKGFSLIVATLLFAFQIYCDFSGYTDIALGSAKLIGFDLMKNFDSPYFSKTIKEFWSRWHISLSSWFRDYVYIPLGGSRVKFSRILCNLMITFLLSGLWHGANWTFFIWGLYHAVLNIIQTIIEKSKFEIKTPNIIKTICTFALVTIGWCFFRANTVGDIGYIFTNAFVGITDPMNYIWQGVVDLKLTRNNVSYIALPIIVLIITDFINYKYKDVIACSRKLIAPVRYATYVVFTYIPVLYFIYQLSLNAPQAFIYFQF